MTVIVYSKPDCPQCTQTVNRLKNIGVDFQKHDVTVDAKAREAALSLGHRAMPIVVAGDKHWAGFRPDMISALA